MRGARASDTWILVGLAGAKLLFHLATHRGYGIFRDELYYLACAAHPDWGYVDHPPFSIWLLALQTALLGDSLFALRLVPALAGAASVFVAGLLAREMGGARGAQVLTALAVFGAPQLLAISHFYSMNVIDWLLWSLLALVVLRILGGGSERGWILFGALAGITLLDKLQVSVLGLGLVVGLLLTPQRGMLARRWIWLGGALAAAVFVPHLIWQARWGWPTLEFIANASRYKIHPTPPLEFLQGQVLLLGPVAAPLWILGLFALFFAPALERFRALGFAYLVIMGVFMVQHAKVYYPTPIYPVLFAAGAVALEGFARARAWRIAVPAAATAVAIGSLAVMPLAVPVLPVETLIRVLKVTGLEQPRTERNETSELPQLFADMHGWTDVVHALARARDALPPDERESVTVLASNYGEAGAVDRFGAALGLPPAISGHNSYWLWGAHGYAGGTILAVGFRSEDLIPYFDDVEEVGRVGCRYCMPAERDAMIYVLRGPKLPVAELWAKVRRFI